MTTWYTPQRDLTRQIMRVKDLSGSPADKDFSDLYLVTELMDTDLYQIIVSPQTLSDEHYQYFTYQTLRGLKALHSAQVLHRDMV
jgi:serine/threonine protein kinase